MNGMNGFGFMEDWVVHVEQSGFAKDLVDGLAERAGIG